MNETNYLDVNGELQIPFEEFDISYARSGGPGGQNVNKVSSKVLLRWPVGQSASLPSSVKFRFLQRYANRITVDGELILTSQRFRDQRRNFDDCMDKLREMLEHVLKPPTLRRATKPTLGSKLRREKGKREHSEKKQGRRQSYPQD